MELEARSWWRQELPPATPFREFFAALLRSNDPQTLPELSREELRVVTHFCVGKSAQVTEEDVRDVVCFGGRLGLRVGCSSAGSLQGSGPWRPV